MTEIIHLVSTVTGKDYAICGQSDPLAYFSSHPAELSKFEHQRICVMCRGVIPLLELAHTDL